MDINNFINCINKNCKKSINPMFNIELHNSNYNIFHFIINGTSFAVNKDELIKVLNWFDNFWLFLEIKFHSKEIVKDKKVSKKNELE